MSRADRYLVAKGHFESRAKAQAAIEAGRVRADGVTVRKASQTIAAGARIEAEPAHPYVSRAALKLIEGLDRFGVDPSGRVALDIGASTGGFSEVLLERGAARVFAVDVGRDQLHASLREEPRLTDLSPQDARTLTAAGMDPAPDLLVCDASFIGLEKILPVPLSLAADRAELIALFKPQFEVGRAHIGRGGLVRSAAAIEEAQARVEAFLAQSGWPVAAACESPITGGDGNREFLLYARRKR